MTLPKRRRIRAAIERTNAVLNREAQASGADGADLRVACNRRGRLRVTVIRSAETSFGGVVKAAQEAGLADPDADYALFVDRIVSVCGYGSFRPDDRPGPDNQNNVYTGYAAIYRDCWTGATPMHEIGHLQGAVQPSAPGSTGRGSHCNEEDDVLCYVDGGERNQSPVYECEFVERFDCGFDDYFDAAPEAGEYLGAHWNVGSGANYFIQVYGGSSPLARASGALGEVRLPVASG